MEIKTVIMIVTAILSIHISRFLRVTGIIQNTKAAQTIKRAVISMIIPTFFIFLLLKTLMYLNDSMPTKKLF